MTNNLTSQEEKQLLEMLKNQPRDIRSLNITANLFLVFGGCFIVGTVFYLLKHFTDNVAYFVGLPNFICGMILIVSYFLLSRRVVRMKQLNSILSKLHKMNVAA
jgi:hypothetical protein